MKRRSIVVTVVVLTVVVVASWARQQMAVESRDQAVTEDDFRILQRADSLLKEVSVAMTIARVLTTRRPARGVCSVRCRKRIERFSASTSIGTSHCRRCDSPFRMPPAIDRPRWLSVPYGNSVCLIGSWTLTIFPKHGLKMLSRCYGSRPNVSEHGYTD